MIDFTGKSDAQIAKMVANHRGALGKDRVDYEPFWSVLQKLFLPRRYDLLQKAQGSETRKGQQYGARVYDGHLANAANKHVLGLFGNMIGKNLNWVNFAPAIQRVGEDDGVKKYMQDAAEQVLWGLGQSNFYGASVWAGKDATVIGNTTQIPEPNLAKGVMSYRNTHPATVFIFNDQYGNPGGFIRDIEMQAIEMLEKFGSAKIPAEILKDAKGEGNRSPFKKHKILFARYINPKPSPISVRADQRAVKEFYLLPSQGDGVGKEAQMLRHTGVDSLGTIWRPGREDGCAYGISLAADAFTDGARSNALKKIQLGIAHKEGDPPMVAHNSFQNKMHLNAGGKTWAEDKAEFIQMAYNRSLNWPLTDAEMKELRIEIDEVFSLQLFQMLTGSRDIPSGTTAFQIRNMLGEKVTLMSTVIDVLEEEYLGPSIEAQFEFERVAGRMPDPPQILLDPAFGGGKIDIQYTGPLEQIRKNVQQSRGLVDGLEVIGAVGEMFPKSLLKVNELQLIEDAGVAMGMDQDLFKSDKEVNDIIAREEAREAQAEQTARMIEGAKAVPGVTGPVDPTSVANKLAEAAA
jgi:hypothetical protein